MEDGETKTQLVTHFEPERPSMKPLKGPPAFWFETVGNDEWFSVRLPEIEALHPVPYERLADPFSGAAFAAVREQLEDEAKTVDGKTIHTMLADAASDPTSVDRREALRFAIRTLQHRKDAHEIAIEAVFALVADDPTAQGRAAFKALRDATKDGSLVLQGYVSELANYASQESMYQRAATRCLMELAETDPGSVLDAVPTLEVAAPADSETTQSFAVYAFSCIAKAYPEEVFPAISVLIEAMQSGEETTQTNALAALGKIASNYPDATDSVVEELVELLDGDNKRTRNNAVGLLADLTQEHPDTVIEYADAIGTRLEDENRQARVNASIALLRAGEADPDAIRRQRDYLESSLTDPNPEVRANVCVLIGNAAVPVDTDQLRDLRENDADETVRDRAAWAVTRFE